MENRDWVVYLIHCADRSLYCGITNDLKKRLTEHDAGKGAKYTRSRRPVELVAVSPKMSKSDALKFEYRIKKLPSGRKIIELTTGRMKPIWI
jgi:putative endonuclease